MPTQDTLPGWDQTKFNRTLEWYAKVSKRTYQQIVNTKAYYVALRWIGYMPKADFAKMGSQLGQLLVGKRSRKTGKLTLTSRRMGQFNSATTAEAPLLSLIINARRGRRAEKGLYGPGMKAEFLRVFSVRAKSIAFFKAGLLPAIRGFEPFADRAGRPPRDSSAKQVGLAKGTLRIAQEGLVPTAEIINLASASRDHKEALTRYGEPARNRAMEDEEASMIEYMVKKLGPDAEQFNQMQKS